VVVQSIREHDHHSTHYVTDKLTLPKILTETTHPDDMIIALGTDDMNQTLPALHDHLEQPTEPTAP
jgi:hypothetical protein